MKAKKILLFASALFGLLGLAACDDDVSQIGSSVTNGEVSIQVDSLTTAVETECIAYNNLDGRNVTKLLGRISVPEYGNLSCSFVSQMMAATRMPVPDSIQVEDIDSMRLVLSVPRGALTGDSLAPQQLRVYRLTDQLPSDIKATYSPEGHYDPVPLGSRSYTLSNIAKGDSALKKDAYIKIPVHMPLKMARDLFTQYRTDNSIFAWPATFNQYFPGIYVQQNFGNGCIANISNAEMYTYWHYTRRVSEMQADSTYQMVTRVYRDSMCLMSSQPEVLSSNVIDYQVSQKIRDMVAAGKSIITTPGGYMLSIKFPVLSLLEEFHRNGKALAIVSSLRFEIPALPISNDYGLGAAPNLLMIKKSEYESFFAENKAPDNKTSFVASYDSDNGRYRFAAMRSWFVNLLEAEQAGETIDEDDYEFILVPVNTVTESVTDYSGNVTTYVTRCQPYLAAPTMTELHTDRSIICFTYSTQQLR
ncbi:MAG: DUF4270 domain-containing protein [Bacteroidales bacterium]|nr:DUF4270 domain-containing protein [Bacteroidales bacterium]MBD5223131.1 DUF4270 domain-containing protein [Bacteroidales bacterium]MBD5302097.1 DUF4270 domain-containing protein [Bacteroides sp.]MBD5348205.1 DUF4270 domain-containing protein [Bacteroides sp.]